MIQAAAMAPVQFLHACALMMGWIESKIDDGKVFVSHDGLTWHEFTHAGIFNSCMTAAYGRDWKAQLASS